MLCLRTHFGERQLPERLGRPLPKLRHYGDIYTSLGRFVLRLRFAMIVIPAGAACGNGEGNCKPRMHPLKGSQAGSASVPLSFWTIGYSRYFCPITLRKIPVQYTSAAATHGTPTCVTDAAKASPFGRSVRKNGIVFNKIAQRLRSASW